MKVCEDGEHKCRKQMFRSSDLVCKGLERRRETTITTMSDEYPNRVIVSERRVGQ